MLRAARLLLKLLLLLPVPAPPKQGGARVRTTIGYPGGIDIPLDPPIQLIIPFYAERAPCPHPNAAKQVTPAG